MSWELWWILASGITCLVGILMSILGHRDDDGTLVVIGIALLVVGLLSAVAQFFYTLFVQILLPAMLR